MILKTNYEEDWDNLEIGGLFNSHASFHASPIEIVSVATFENQGHTINKVWV